MIQPDFRLNDEDIEAFRRDGFVKLTGFLSREATSLLDASLVRELEGTTSVFSTELSRYKYDMENDDDLQVVEHPVFKETLARLCQRSMLYTQHLGLELASGVSAGLSWHIEQLSFAYQQISDFGCTLWIPLAPIRRAGQGGGMHYVPKSLFSGRFLYQYATFLSSYAQKRKADGAPLSKDELGHLDCFIQNTPELASMLAAHAESHDFEVGDALLFDKEVLHRSCPLAPGPLAARRAYILRFVDAASTYDRDRVDKLDPFKESLEYGVISTFPDRVARADRAALIDSPLFEATLERRFLPLREDMRVTRPGS